MTGPTGTGQLGSDDNTHCMATSRTTQQL